MATEFLLAPERTAADKLAGATSYLRLFGLVAGSSLILRGILRAQDEPVMQAQMTGVFGFLTHQLLAGSAGQARAICAAAATLAQALPALELV
jgi:hypothetical protein